MSKLRSTSYLAASMVFIGVATSPIREAVACSTHGLVQAATLDAFSFGGPAVGGLGRAWISIEDGLIPPSSPTFCAAGIGLRMISGDVPPVGFDVLDAQIAIGNHATGEHVPLSLFNFQPHPTTSLHMAAGSGQPTLSGTNPLFEGAAWYGFVAPVEPFALPTLSDQEYIELRFLVTYPLSALPLELSAQFAAGAAQSDGSIDFSQEHPVQYFTATNHFVNLVPEPGAGIIAAAMACLTLARRRRSRIR